MKALRFAALSLSALFALCACHNEAAESPEDAKSVLEKDGFGVSLTPSEDYAGSPIQEYLATEPSGLTTYLLATKDPRDPSSSYFPYLHVWFFRNTDKADTWFNANMQQLLRLATNAKDSVGLGNNVVYLGTSSAVKLMGWRTNFIN
ncbi:MAG: hypothetical protein K6E59_04460 [Bacilli bacterium]|nr:hypothetical protein [Bacilli bacterium]